MDEHTEPRTWPCLLPEKKRCRLRLQDPVTGAGQSIPYDRISFLPDAIQILILNFLPLKEGFKTSVLSKNWRHLCYSLPSLSFVKPHMKDVIDQTKDDIDQTKDVIDQTKDVIDQVLRNYKQPTIDLLSIYLHEPVPHNHMDEWVSFAASHHVQTFIFWDVATSEAIYTVPSSIFTCANLKVLKLKNMRINIPSETVFLPSLIYLQLFHCRFTDVVFSTSNYPMLGKLIISNCQYDTLSISSSVLNYLHIVQSVGYPEVNLLSIPSLSTICYLGEDPPNISLETLLSLQLVYFVIRTDHFRSWDLVDKMLKGLPSVRDLRVGAFYVECLRLNWGQRRLLDYSVAPCFSSVKYLRVGYSAGKRHVPVLKVLLRSYPNLVFLETRCLVETTEDDNNIAGYWEEKEKERLPANFLNSLVTYDAIYIGEDEDSEFELMKFVVENAMELMNINISVGAKVKINAENVRQKLNTFSQKSSSRIKVVISGNWDFRPVTFWLSK